MSKIAIIGYGNIGYHFSRVLSRKNQVSIFSRTPVEDGINELKNFNPDHFDFIFITITDDAIKPFAESFDTEGPIVIHTSGARPMADLANHKRTGVIYPLQTISKDKNMDSDTLKLFIESTAADYEKVLSVARFISENCTPMTSEERGKMHLSAVFACNFTNHMYHLAENFLKDIDLPFIDLHPLIKETLDKAIAIGPAKSQTGPSIRNDTATLAYHEGLIEDEATKELYQLISKSIQKHH